MTNSSASWIVEFFHLWPHISFSFSLVSRQDYAFDNDTYLESLAMIALMAIVWLVLTMTVLAINFCCVKSRAKSESTYSPNGCYCSVCVYVVFLMLTLGCIGAALYGNMQATDGIKIATVSVQAGNETFYTLAVQVENLYLLSTDMKKSVSDLKLLEPDDLAVTSVEKKLFKVNERLNDISVPLHSIEDRLGWSVNILVVSEQYRKISTITLLALQCFVCFLGLLGLCCRSKWMLILMIVLGMIGITATCFYLGADLMISVAISDFCIDPYTSIYNQTVDKGYMNADEARYFLSCNKPGIHPYQEDFEEGRADMKNILSFAKWSGENSTKKEQEIRYSIQTSAQEFSKSLNSLEIGLQCEPTSAALKDFIASMCGTTIEGFFALAAAIFGITLCMSIVICAAAKTGRRYGKGVRRSSSIEDLDYSDPFLPRSTHYNSGSGRNAHVTRTNNPIYATTTSSNTNYGVATNTLSFFRPGSDENVSLIDSPPPYSPPRISGRSTD